MKPQLAEAAGEKLPSDFCANSLSPRPRMHNVGNLALALRVTADMQLTHTDNIAPDAHYMGKPLPGRARPGLDRGLHENACLVLGVRSPRLETTSLRETGPRVNGLPVVQRDLVQGNRVLTHYVLPISCRSWWVKRRSRSSVSLCSALRSSRPSLGRELQTRRARAPARSTVSSAHSR